MNSNDIQHEKMFGILEKITWIIEFVKGEEVVARHVGFAVSDNLIMTSAGYFSLLIDYWKKKKQTIQARARVPNNGWVPLKQVLVKRSWDIIIFQFRSDMKCEVGKFVSNGTLSEKQILLHMGLNSYHITRPCSRCLEDVNLPSWDDEVTCNKYKPLTSETIPVYPIMGHVFNEEGYKKYMETHPNDFDYIVKYLHPLVPIIQLYGFDSHLEHVGGPIINNSGEIVGMFAGIGEECIGIHVTALKEALKLYTG